MLSRGGNPSALYEAVGLDKDVFIDESFIKEGAIEEGALEESAIEKNFTVEKTNSLLIPFDKFIYLLETAAKELDFPGISMELAKRQDMMILAPLGPMLKPCKDLADALDVILKYIKILVSGYYITVDIQPDCLTLTFQLELPHIQDSVQYQDYAMAIAMHILNGLTGRRFPIRGCFFLRHETNKSRTEEYSRYYGCPVAFGCSALSLTCDSAILLQDVSHLQKQLNHRISNALLSGNIDTVGQVTRVISFSLANGRCNLNSVASAMYQSPRTLQRKLEEQGTSFSALLDSVRFNMANQYLNNHFYRLTDIAVQLGYSNLSGFSRSYFRWSGVYPSEVRHRLQPKNKSQSIT